MKLFYMKHRYIGIMLAMSVFLSCSDLDHGKDTVQGELPLEKISVNTKIAVSVKSQDVIDEESPTLSPSQSRSGHMMYVALGSGESIQTAEYVFENGYWIPDGEGVDFPDNNRQELRLELRKSGVVLQDGTAQALIDADALEWTNLSQVPVRELANAPMTHSNAMIQFDFADIKVSTIDIGGQKPYQVPESNVWQFIIEPGTEQISADVEISGNIYSLEILQSDSPTDGMFKSNYIYELPVVLDGVELKVGDISVGQWGVGSVGTASGMSRTRFTLYGLDGKTIDVFLSGNENPVSVTLDDNGMGTCGVGTPVGIVQKIEIDGVQYLIGREESSLIVLSFNDDGQLVFTEDAQGVVQLGSVAELQMINREENVSRTYSLTASLDMMNEEWDPIYDFQGTFDGNGNELRNMNVSTGAQNQKNAGFAAKNSGTVKNLAIKNADLVGAWHAAALCGENYGRIEGCVLSGILTGQASNTLAGICGYNAEGGVISGCMNDAEIVLSDGASIPSDGVGGICGNAYLSIIEMSENDGDINGILNNAGGICGNAYDVTISQCTNSGNLLLSWGSALAGGIIGKAGGGQMKVLSCLNSGEVNLDGSDAGGICGNLNNAGTVESCKNTGTVMAKYNTGGICGNSDNGYIRASYNTGDINVQSSVDLGTWAGAGGICGFHKGEIEACYNVGEVAATHSAVGEIAGEHNTGNIRYCFWSGDLNCAGNGSAAQTGNSRFSSSAWPDSSMSIYWGTDYWKTLGASGGSYPVLLFE